MPPTVSASPELDKAATTIFNAVHARPGFKPITRPDDLESEGEENAVRDWRTIRQADREDAAGRVRVAGEPSPHPAGARVNAALVGRGVRMCGLIKQRSNDDPFVSELRFEPPFGSDAKPADAKPADVLPVFRRHPETGLPTESYLRWGLIPHDAKARPEIRPHNARAETITEKRMFRDAYRSRRCVVPMDAFYERDRNRKLHLFALTHQPVFGVAGIWDNWRNPVTEQWERTFAIITVEANELVAQVHDRMPAILRNDEHARWLGTEADPRDLLRPYPTDLMTVQPVSRRRS